MNMLELKLALTTFSFNGIANSLEARLLQAQTEKLTPIDLLSVLVQD